MPKHYPGPVTYQKDEKFERVSVRNVRAYVVMHSNPEYICSIRHKPVGSCF